MLRVWVVGRRGGFVALDQTVQRFIGVSYCVGGAGWVNIMDICRFLAIASIYWVYPFD